MPNILLEISGEITPERMKGWSQSKNNTQLWMGLVIGARFDVVKSREGTQAHPSTENWTKDLLSLAPPIRTRPSVPLNQSVTSGSFHKPLNLLHQKADRVKTTITEN